MYFGNFPKRIVDVNALRHVRRFIYVHGVSGARISFPHVSKAQRLAQARTRTRIVRLGA